MYHVPLAFQCIYVCNDEGVEDGDGKEGSKIPGGEERMEIICLLYADDFVMCGESDEDLRVMVERFEEMCRRRGLKVNASKSRMMVLNGEVGVECEPYEELRGVTKGVDERI